MSRTIGRVLDYFSAERRMAKEQEPVLRRLERAEGQEAAVIIFDLAVEGAAKKTVEELKTRFTDKLSIKNGEGYDGWHWLQEYGGVKRP